MLLIFFIIYKLKNSDEIIAIFVGVYANFFTIISFYKFLVKFLISKTSTFWRLRKTFWIFQFCICVDYLFCLKVRKSHFSILFFVAVKVSGQSSLHSWIKYKAKWTDFFALQLIQCFFNCFPPHLKASSESLSVLVRSSVWQSDKF